MTAAVHSSRESHSEWVRLRTLVNLRWTAVFGQIVAIGVAWLVYDIALDLALCLLIVGATVLANLLAMLLFPENRRLSETETMLTLVFDTAQLALLLAVTGGLDNPFALLILAPTAIAATALHTLPTVIVGMVTITLVSLLGIYSAPIMMYDGTLIAVPEIFEFGIWVAIIIGVVFLGIYARRVSSEIHSMGDALLATQMALAREQKLTDLGGVVAAAAHELGTPLATIKLVSTELADELDDRPELREDALLIRQQADRCRDILRSMGRAGKDDKHLRVAPLLAVLREAAEPHLNRGKTILFEAAPGPGGSERQPSVIRFPELVHALRNLVQNAVDFARETVWVEAEWSTETITVRIVDDGPGYPPGVLGRIGDPFLSARKGEADRGKRAEYEGMGLGLFIAKTLLERTGARLKFANGTAPFLQGAEYPGRSGAVVEVVWPAARIASAEGALGENQPIIR
ncbi:MAG: ActS/PrrB/RegB family redox-sensitive histidine kinase [Phaeovulum sp.]|uniref:sensor histidine kinase RegB n=1 Tax=Phaeovulum sp. TaxID=2934796 RepID=UPI002731FA43|nr:ActS/PrrB/RegB family redox-sensitive histidine kinase [Phaeovulum sp.]MDP2062175.1 ActS/PrrB/RegB family redox-sensitive histidine kinase [Phaeovulum sp.]